MGQTVPEGFHPCNRIICRDKLNPIPDPFSRVVKKGTKICSSISFGIPEPLSITHILGLLLGALSSCHLNSTFWILFNRFQSVFQQIKQNLCNQVFIGKKAPSQQTLTVTVSFTLSLFSSAEYNTFIRLIKSSTLNSFLSGLGNRVNLR